MKAKYNPGTYIAMALFTGLLWALFGPVWALSIAALSVWMYEARYEGETKRRNAKRMQRELRRQAKNHNTQVLSDMYDERHPK